MTEHFPHRVVDLCDVLIQPQPYALSLARVLFVNVISNWIFNFTTLCIGFVIGWVYYFNWCQITLSNWIVLNVNWFSIGKFNSLCTLTHTIPVHRFSVSIDKCVEIVVNFIPNEFTIQMNGNSYFVRLKIRKVKQNCVFCNIMFRCGKT